MPIFEKVNDSATKEWPRIYILYLTSDACFHVLQALEKSNITDVMNAKYFEKCVLVYECTCATTFCPYKGH